MSCFESPCFLENAHVCVNVRVCVCVCACMRVCIENKKINNFKRKKLGEMQGEDGALQKVWGLFFS